MIDRKRKSGQAVRSPRAVVARHRMKNAHVVRSTRDSARKSAVDVQEFRDGLGLSRKVFSRLCGYSERTIAEWEAGKRLSAGTEKRIVELMRLERALCGVMKKSFVGEWLQTPNAAFRGLKPIEVIERGEIDRIWRMIHQLQSGEPA
jgi:DNA-binding transcriptional regulator YiaG